MTRSNESEPQAEAPDDLGQSMELVRRAQEGDEQALSKLFDRYWDRVHRVARIRAGARIRKFMDSADLVQNTYMVAMRRFQSFEMHNHASIIQWLARILENQIRDASDYANAAKRNPDREVPVDDVRGDDSVCGHVPEAKGPSPEQALTKQELRAIYDSCVKQLEDRYREAILLRDYSKGSWEFVAKELGCPSGQAAQELHRRARTKLARLFSKRIDMSP